MASDVTTGLARVHERMDAAARSAGRAPEDVRLIAVSKRQPVSAIREAYAAGQRDFGENYVQELCEKAEQLRDLPDLRWHMIGQVQRNKAAKVLTAAAWIHTIDSERLVAALDKRMGQRAQEPDSEERLPVLVEVNVAGEAQKHGCEPDAVPALLEALDASAWLSVRGLMTVAPFDTDGEVALSAFRKLAALRDAHGGAARLPELSMGMSGDLEQAIVAGATMVRVGTAIFGERT